MGFSYYQIALWGIFLWIWLVRGSVDPGYWAFLPPFLCFQVWVRLVVVVFGWVVCYALFFFRGLGGFVGFSGGYRGFMAQGFLVFWANAF